MKDFCIKSLDQFLRIADSIDTPFKFYESKDSMIRAEVWLRTALLSWEGEKLKEREEELRAHGFSEAELRETKKTIIFEELV